MTRKLPKPRKKSPFQKVAAQTAHPDEATLIMQQWLKEADEKFIKKQGREGSAFPKDK